MKKYILLLCFLSIFKLSQSQTEINYDFANQMNSLFAPLDKTKVPHGILLDYGMEFTNVPAFNGTLTDSTYTNIAILKQLYNTLLSSRIQNVTTGFVTPQQFNTNLANNRNANAIAITGLFFKYAKFNDDALANNKITYANGQLDDKYINGVWQNPYEDKITFAMTPAIKFYKGYNLNIIVPSAIFYSNYTSQIQSIQIDFNNGLGYITVPFDQNVAVSYSSSGTKTWKYKLTLTDNNVMYNQSLIKIEDAIKTQQGALRSSSSCFMPDVNITASTAYLGGFGTVKLTIDDANCDGIKKPLIVAEGFDVGSIFTPENPEGLFDYGDFRTFLSFSGTELRNLIYNSNKDYDIIYIDWGNGVDYMQRNAYALEAVITYVNQQKANNNSTEENVVLGQSMGGIIARWALADMEENSIDHDTRLFISHDAPQQGANMPVSLQFLYRHINNQFIQAGNTLLGNAITIPILDDLGASTYLSLLDAPASRQLLKNFSTLNYAIDNTTHDSFYNELKNKGLTNNSGGYPIYSRNIALSNGSECGDTQDFNPGDDIVNLYSDRGLSFWGDLLSLIYNPLGGLAGGLFVDADFFGVAVLGLVPGHSRYNINFWAKTIPYGSGNQIYNGRISYSKQILWIGPTIVVNITDIDKDQPAGVLPYDTYGGGFYNVNNFIDTSSLPSELYIRDKFNFIPTASALDIGENNITLDDSDYLRSYVGGSPPSAPKNSPFVNFSTEFDTNPNAHNKQHISFNTRNGDWLAAELIGTNIEFTNCSFVCDDGSATITGGNTSCTLNTYSVNVSGDALVNWSISNTSVASLSSPTGTTVTLTTPPNSYRTDIVLTAVISSSKCGSSITLTKNIRIGKPDVPSSINGPAIVNTGALVSYSAGPSIGATSYAWYLPYPYTTVSTFDYFGQNWQLQAPGNTNIARAFTGYAKNAGYVQVMGENACGKGGARLLYVQHASTGGGGGGGIASVDPTDNVKEVILYPNPAKNKVTVSINLLDEYEGGFPPTLIYGIKILDLNSIERRFYEFKEFKNTDEINVAFLSTGLYTLIVYTDTDTFIKKLLIK
tara:strand:+ start:24836 stop:28015 length:3180 start_codon:yes stop_codon:yes gene_type:complete